MDAINVEPGSFPVSGIDPFSDDYLLNPYPYHDEMRALGPLVWLEKWNIWAVARHAEAQTILNDWRTFCSGAGVGLTNFKTDEFWRPPSPLLETDPPHHTTNRTVMNRVVSPANLKKLREGFEIAADALLDRVLHAGELDGVTDIAQPYVLKVFPDAVGLAPDDRIKLLAYGEMVFNALGPRNWVFEESFREAASVSEWVLSACRRENLSPEGLGRMVYEGVDSGEISEETALLMVRAILSAGLDTTVHAIGNILLAFAKHPKEWEKLKADPTRARASLEEVLRYESPFQCIFRTTAKPVDFAGQSMPENQKILVLLGSANRDPSKWENPTEFNLDRKTQGHLIFGTGIHGCIGQMISRLEMEVLLVAMARRVDRIDLLGEPKHKPNNTLRGLSTLPVRLISK